MSKEKRQIPSLKEENLDRIMSEINGQKTGQLLAEGDLVEDETQRLIKRHREKMADIQIQYQNTLSSRINASYKQIIEDSEKIRTGKMSHADFCRKHL